MKEHAYKNGNVFIGVKEDGSKIYYTPDGEEPNPIYPETINLKITNKCDIECGYCCEGLRRRRRCSGWRVRISAKCQKYAVRKRDRRCASCCRR